MNPKPFAQTASAGPTSALTRRRFVKSLAVAGAAFAVFPRVLHAAFVAGAAPQIGPPVVWFYMDRLYVDVTGTAVPYLPPLGLRSGAPLAHLSEEACRRAQLYV